MVIERDFVAIVLAAGRGKRFGGGKLAARLGGASVIEHSVAIALAAPVGRVIVVTRPGLALPRDPRVERVELDSPALSDSLKAGLAAAGQVDGAFVFLGDMPLVPPGLAARLVAAVGDAPAAMPVWRERPGHPVFLSHSAYYLAEGLADDEGLGRALRDLPGVVRMPVDEEGAVLDVDRPEDLAALAARFAP